MTGKSHKTTKYLNITVIVIEGMGNLGMGKTRTGTGTAF